MKGELLKREQLHEYQNYCVRFIEDHEESLLILEMGLGKTIITLTAILNLMFDRFEAGRVLVIAPFRVGRDVWPEELCQWSHTAFLTMSVAIGSPKERIAALNARTDICVINRENVKWLVDYYAKIKRPWPFDLVVIDELSSFKNHQSQRWKALRKVRPFIKRMIGLTGTPVSNGLMDLWAEVGIVDGGKRLGRFIGRYREAFFRPSGMNPYTGVVYSYVPLPGSEEAIYGKIADITISMKALQYLNMPECMIVKHLVEMDAKERKAYDRMKSDLTVTMNGETVDATNAATLSGKLQQMANGCVYTDEKDQIIIHDKKLLMLEDLIEQANGQNVLVAYWYRHDRERILAHLKKVGYEPRDLRSSEDIEDWNDGKISVAIISPASAGHGLNIQRGGHILIWFSLIWSLEMVQQTNARLWRQGQKEMVTIHWILCKDTVDEDIAKAIEQKDVVQERLISAVKARLQ